MINGSGGDHHALAFRSWIARCQNHRRYLRFPSECLHWMLPLSEGHVWHLKQKYFAAADIELGGIEINNDNSNARNIELHQRLTDLITEHNNKLWTEAGVCVWESFFVADDVWLSCLHLPCRDSVHDGRSWVDDCTAWLLKIKGFWNECKSVCSATVSSGENMIVLYMCCQRLDNNPTNLQNNPSKNGHTTPNIEVPEIPKLPAKPTPIASQPKTINQQKRRSITH